MFLQLKFILHTLLPYPVPVHCPVSTPHIHDTVMRRQPFLLPLLDSLQACNRETPRVLLLLFKPDQFGNFSSRYFQMNSLFRVWENTSLFCSRLMTAGVSLRGITLVIPALPSRYSTPRDSQECKVTESMPDLALSLHGSLSNPRRGCAWRDLFAAPVQVYPRLETSLLNPETLRFPGLTLIDPGLYISNLPPLFPAISKLFIKKPTMKAGFTCSSLFTATVVLYTNILFAFAPLSLAGRFKPCITKPAVHCGMLRLQFIPHGTIVFYTLTRWPPYVLLTHVSRLRAASTFFFWLFLVPAAVLCRRIEPFSALLHPRGIPSVVPSGHSRCLNNLT